MRSKSTVPSGLRRWMLGLCLVFYAAALAWQAARHGPNLDELGHLAAGVAVWELGRADLYAVNPPLVKTVAALPALVAGARTDWFGFRVGPGVRTEAKVGQDFLRANGAATFRYLTWGRWALIPVALLGAVVCHRWAAAVYGDDAGLAALVMWCLAPNLTAYAATINADTPAAVFGVGFGYTFWCWQRTPTWLNTLLATLFLTLALLTKFSWLILLPLVPLLALFAAGRPGFGKLCFQAAAMLLLTLYLVNAAYGFSGTLRPYRDYGFVSRLFAGSAVFDPEQGYQGNRFEDVWLGRLPVPLPSAYLRGIDLQQRDFDLGKRSYLCGRWKQGGWWYYYLIAVAVKVPLAFLMLVVWRCWLVRCRPPDGRLRDDAFLLAPAAALFVLVSNETGFTIYLRYVLGCFPFVLVWISSVFTLKSRRARIGQSILLGWAAFSSLAVLPHSHSYFNELAGGPRGGHRWLLDANVDWGEDLFDLQSWCVRHPDAAPLYVAGRFAAPVEFACPRAIDISRLYQTDDPVPKDGRPKPGWYVISIHDLHEWTDRFRWFRGRRPEDRIAYSLLVFRVD